MPFSTKCFHILFKFKLCSVKLPQKLKIAWKLELLVPSLRLVLKLDLFYGFRESSCSSSNLNKNWSKLVFKLVVFVLFRASSNSSSNVLYGFEQARARTFCMVSSKLELFFLSSKQPELLPCTWTFSIFDQTNLMIILRVGHKTHIKSINLYFSKCSSFQ